MRPFHSSLITLFLLFQSVLAVNYANVLIYTYAAGYVHDSTIPGAASMTNRGPDLGIYFTTTNRSSDFNDDYLSQFDAVFFISNTDEVLDTAGKQVFQKYLDLGGNFAGAHAASDCMLSWTTMERTLGSQFDYHPDFTNATMLVLDSNHPSTMHLPGRWHVQDEIYNFVQDPRDLGAVVVLAADETSYIDTGDRNPSQGSPHPIAWYQEHLKGTNSTGLVGRSWYTGLGHATTAWEDDTFMSHIMGGIAYVLASNTTRWSNPDANVGSLGPVYDTPSPDQTDEPVPTTTVRSGTISLRHDRHAGLYLAGLISLLALSWLI